MIRCKSILATTVLTLSVVFSLFPEPRAAAGSKGLFTESRSPVQFRAQSNSRSLRSRHVKIDFDLLGDARGFRRASQKGRQSLELNLFPDVSFVAVLDKIEPHAKGYSWIGRVQGSQDSIVILTVTDNVMAGNVSVSGTAYQIRHIEAGVHAIREVDPAATRPEAEPIQVGSEQGIPTFGTPSISPDQGGKSDSSPDRTYFLPGSNASFAVSPDAPSFPQSGSGEFFDLLVVYTASARSAAGGTAGIESLIQLGVTETNLAYQNSGIISQIRLVHTAEVNYTESGNLDTDLAYAQLGFVDNTHALRDTYGADLVQLVTDSNASFCGKAYVMSGNNPGFQWWSYSVVEQSCISPNYSFGHELGHNMGCNHAPGDPLDVGAYPYSLGYKDPSNQFRTLMAYNAGCNCTRVLRHSNQSLTYQGSPTGNSTQDNSLSINNVRFTVSGFRDEPSCEYTTSPGSQSFLESGGVGSLTVSTSGSCSWTSGSSDGWISITGGGSGTGNGSVSYSVSSNPTTQARSGSITVEGEVLTIDQDALPCTYGLSSGSASFGFAGGSSSVGMTSLTGCAWTASSSDGWVTITAGGSGSGNGTISYTVASNPTISTRVATITAGGQVFSITQGGIPCTYSLSPGSANFGSGGGGTSFGMTSPTGCTWTASSSAGWITITAGGSGSGNGTVSYTVASNTTINSRSGTITAGGQVYNITQDGIPCTYSLSPGSNSFDSNGGGGSFGMTSPSGCTWTASSSAGWITITAGGSGSGNGTISYTVASNTTINSRSATITAGGQVFNITQDGIPCTYSLSPGSANFDSNGGGGSVSMTSPTGCTWTASSSAGWITITAGGSGSGNGSISYTVAANTTINSRSSTITVAGQTLAITQTGIDCTYSLSSGSASFDSDGGGGVVGMTSPTGCTWTASSSASWITITAGGSGSGNGTISYTVAANTTINSRSGTITVAGQTLAISQTGIDCTYSLSSGSASFDSDGGGGVVGMTSPTGCTWTASSSAGWITITAGGSGSGNGTISYTVAANTTINSRSGTITVAGQTLTITQTGIDCSYSLSSGSASFDSDGGGGSVSMTSPTGCTWTASSSAGWITITAGGSGSGNGSISYTIAANTTINSRSGTITVAGQTLAITQTGIDCTYSLSSGSASFDSDGGGGSVSMTSPTGCTWTASSSAGWITITAGGSGSGNGTISYTVAANTTINTRTGTITVAGQTLTITQTGIDCTYSLSSGSASFDSDGASASVSMTSPTGCTWTASSSAGWITITAGGSGSGNGTISYTVAANTTINSRSGTITVAGQTLAITQTGIDCTYSLSSGSAPFDSDGGGAGVSMTSPTGCTWTASSSAGWITITAGGSGSGNGSISYTVAANTTINSRSGTITVAGQTLAISQTGIDCTYSLSSGSASFDSDGGGASVSMTSPTGCTWTASSSAGWITITAGGSGSGNGSISYTVAANTTINTRSGTITVAGQTLAISQTGIDCTYSLSSGSASFDSDGGSGSVSMTSPTGCTWTASSSAGWITITAGGSGSGNGSISYTVAANTTINSRSGTITVAGQTLAITQTGIDCIYSLSSGSASFDSDGGGGVVGMTSPTGCSWTASSSGGWITITAGGSGSGNGTISYTVAANTTINTRTGTITVEDQVLTLTQEAISCTYALSPSSASFESDGGSSTASITTPDVCSWSASSSEGWITITTGTSGSGNGSLSFIVAPNTTIESRSGTIAVEGQVLTISQSRVDCSYSLSSASASFDSDGGSGNVSLTSPDGCSWTASSSAGWIDISSGVNGSGSSTLSFSVDANPAVEPRVGSLTIGSEVFSISQDGIACSYSLSFSSVSFDSGGDSGTVSMAAPNGCAWTASSSESWITVAGASGNGDGSISYSVATNPSIQSRSGTIVVEGQVLTITQGGIDCTYSLSPSSSSFDSEGGSGSTSVSSPDGCQWSASSNESWISITSGGIGSGDGPVSFTVAANTTIQARSGSLTVGGQVLTITQDGIPCSYSLSSVAASFDADGGSNSTNVDSPDGCTWSASSSETWIAISSVTSGSGNGSVSFTVAANDTIQSRSGTITVEGQVLSITQAGIECTYSLSSSSASFDFDAGSGSIDLTSPTGCSWTASSSESWITINAGASGSGNGSVSFAVTANVTIQSRSGVVTAGDQVLTITQGGIDCTYSLSLHSASFDSSGGSSSVSVTSPNGCEWSASGNDGWITITAGASGSGDGSVSFSVAANTTIQSRSGSVMIGGQAFTITQDGIPCTYSLTSDSASFDAEGGSGSVGMNSPDGCEWSASNSESWITINGEPSGSGDGPISFTAAANATIYPRSGTITVAGRVLTITQDGIDCSYSLSSSGASFAANGGSSSVSVSSPEGCEWSASSSESWITFGGGASGSGDGPLSFSVSANSTIQSRSGTMTLEGQALTVTQGGIDCTYSLSASNVSLGSEGGSSSVDVTSPDGCEWSASSSENWITIGPGASGSGNGTVSVAVAANPSIQSRSGSIMVGGEAFSIAQDGLTCSFSLSSSSASFDAGSGSGSVSISSPAGCDWSASSSESWIAITAGATGSGDGSISFTVTANSTIESRSGTITVEGQVLAITQGGIDCTYSLSPDTVFIGFEGSNGSLSVSTPEGCEWSASSSDSWLTISNGGSGSGSGSVSFTADENVTIQSRFATIVAGGQVSTITQEGISCTYTLSSSNLSLESDGGISSVGISSPDGCQWSASSSESWIVMGAEASGSGSGNASFTVAPNDMIQSRSGTILVEGQVLTLNQEGIDCTYSLSPSSASFDPEGGGSAAIVTSPEGCEWSASASDGWIEISTGSSGSGTGPVSFTVASNESTQSRTAAITVAEQELTITQGGIDCAYSLSPSSASFDAEDGSSSVSVTSPEGCEWSASASESWITVSSGSTGSGDGSVSFTVDANATIQTRTGTIVAGGKVFAITQEGISCTYEMSPNSSFFDSEGGISSAAVTSPEGCEWSASSSESWISVGAGANGSGSSDVSFTVEANDTIESRSGTMVVEGQVLTITQDGIECTYSLSPTSASFDPEGGTSTANVTSPEGCEWSASSSDSWISISTGASGSGNGSLSFTVETNAATEPRSGTITVEDRVLTITQSRIDCSLSLSSTSATFDSDGGEGSVDVTSPEGCNWSAFSGDSWIEVSSGASANGNGSVSFIVDANGTSESRSGTVMVEDEVLTITQSGAVCSFSLSSDSVAFDSDGGEGSFGVLSPSGCSWSASSGDGWITLVSESHGDGDGFVSFAVASNSVTESRSGAITIEDQVLTVTQSGIECSYSLSPGIFPLTSDENSGSVNVTSPQGCEWSAASSDGWISISAGSEGIGSGLVSFTVAANPSPESRSGSIAVEDQVVTINQGGLDCSYSLSSTSTSIDGAGGNDEIYVSAPEGCSWTVASNVEWVVIAQGDRGTGNGSFLCVVEANPTIQSRSGTLEVEGQTIMVTQAGAECTYAASATSTLFEGEGGSGNITVTTLDGCDWSASTGAEWITLGTATASGGTGTVEFEVLANPSGESRTGTVAIEETVVTITQAWDSGPTLEIELSAARYSAGDFVEATSLLLSNTGPEAVETEIWMVLETPRGDQVSFFHMGADGSVLLPSQFSDDFGPVTLFEITSDLRPGKYILTGLVRDATTADLLSQDVETFNVVGGQGGAGDPRIQSGIPKLPNKTKEGWQRALERLAKPRGEERKSLPVPKR